MRRIVSSWTALGWVFAVRGRSEICVEVKSIPRPDGIDDGTIFYERVEVAAIAAARPFSSHHPFTTYPRRSFENNTRTHLSMALHNHTHHQQQRRFFLFMRHEKRWCTTTATTKRRSCSRGSSARRSFRTRPTSCRPSCPGSRRSTCDGCTACPGGRMPPTS